MPLDADDEKKIAALIAGALKTNNDELGKQFVTTDAATKIVEQSFAKGIEGLKLEEKIAAAIKGAAPAAGAGEGDKKGKDGKPDGGAADPAVARLAEELENLKKANRASEEARQAAETRAREQAMEAAAKDALAKAGVPAERHAHALAYLRTRRTEDGKPVLDTLADGRVVWRDQKKGYVDEVSLADGLKGWAATDDGKVYIPPTGQGGTGTGAGNSGGNAGQGTVKPSDLVITLG